VVYLKTLSIIRIILESNDKKLSESRIGNDGKEVVLALLEKIFVWKDYSQAPETLNRDSWSPMLARTDKSKC
jgi:hypothetical protein